jgi:hypothetical protein
VLVRSSNVTCSNALACSVSVEATEAEGMDVDGVLVELKRAPRMMADRNAVVWGIRDRTTGCEGRNVRVEVEKVFWIVEPGSYKD